MFAPKLYVVCKFPFSYLAQCNFNYNGDVSEYKINQQDNLLFRQVRLITHSNSRYNPYVVFIDCKGYSTRLQEFSNMIINGFYINGKHYNLCERSASMTRQGILSFIRTDISDELDKRITMEVNIKETVLSKYMAYRGLMFSSCHCLENWYPKVIVVPDLIKTIYNQKIKFVYDKEIPYIDNETGEPKIWKEKAITEGVRDIEINVFDGAGIHHPAITTTVKDKLNSKTLPTSILWRLPFIKGVTHNFDYTNFLLERGVKYIIDIWGVKHDVNDPMIILTESMYKGKKYFERDGTYKDWDNYWQMIHKYEHCIGVAKWNFSKDEEPVYTRGNYQILQDLELDYDDFGKLAKDSIKWAEDITSGEIFSLYCFLGIFYDKHSAVNDYVKAIFKNPEMAKEQSVRDYLKNLLHKYIDEFKCGKLWLNGCFKILTPDLVAMVEHIGGLNVKGCLEFDEFYSNNIDGDLMGEFLIERNPHICKSEHTILRGISNDYIRRWCGSLSNICMINSKSLTPQRLNGAD